MLTWRQALRKQAGAPGYATAAWTKLSRLRQACMPGGHHREHPELRLQCISLASEHLHSPHGQMLPVSILRGANFCASKNFAPVATFPKAPHTPPLGCLAPSAAILENTGRCSLERGGVYVFILFVSRL